MPGADDDLLATKAARRGVDPAGFDIAHQGGKVEFHFQFLTQIVDQRRNRFPRIQLLIVPAMQRGAVMAKLAAVQIIQRGALQQFDVVAVLLGATGAEGFQQMLFGFGAGEQVRAIALDLKTDHGAKAALLALGQFVLRVALEAGVVDLLYAVLLDRKSVV